jgi:hypothetical protein
MRLLVSARFNRRSGLRARDGRRELRGPPDTLEVGLGLECVTAETDLARPGSPYVWFVDPLVGLTRFGRQCPYAAG